MNRRGFLAGAALAAVGTAGCPERDPGGDPDTATPLDGPTDEPTATPTETAPGHEHAARQPDPDLSVTVENRHDEPHSLSITVARETGEVVHESDQELDPGVEYEAYNLEEADPDGIERFTVSVESGDHREEIGVRTSECYGLVVVGFDARGELSATYAVC